MVQRGIRQHQPELAVPRRDRLGEAGPGQPGQQHDRPPAAGQQAGRGLVHLAQPAGRRDVGHHHGERLVLAVLACPQYRCRRLAGRVHGQVIAAQPLHREHLSLAQQGRRGRERLTGRRRLTGRSCTQRAEQGQRGTAGRAAGGLGVESPVGWIVVLRRAQLAHRERRHRGARTVVGNIADDREPWPAVGAVDERVAEPPVARISELGQAVRAGRGVGGDERPPTGTGLARRDRERGGAVRPHGRRGDPLDPRQRGRVAGQGGQEFLDHRRGPLDLSEHPVGVVADHAAEPEAGGERVHERTEADPLDDSLDPDRRPDPLVHPSSVATGGTGSTRSARQADTG